MHSLNHIEKKAFHFNFLRDVRVHGLYMNTLSSYLNLYPFLKMEHTHDFYSLVWFTKGRGSINIHNHSHPVGPRTICLVGANQDHVFDNLGDADGMILLFCQDFYVKEFSFIRLLNLFAYTCLPGQHPGSPCLELNDQEYTSIQSLMDALAEEYQSYTPGNHSADIMCSLLNTAILKLTDLYQAKTGQVSKGDSMLIHTLSHLVESHFINEQQTGFYASTLNVTETRLNELCNSHFQCGLKKILQNRLMQEARKRLLSTELSVAEIAYQLNFNDNSYFNKVFKVHTGITPKKFRLLHRKLLP
jgi:AraC family transcriptional regulator, transcriptional activator of pobA